MRLDCAQNFALLGQNSTLARHNVLFRSAKPPDIMDFQFISRLRARNSARLLIADLQERDLFEVEEHLIEGHGVLAVAQGVIDRAVAAVFDVERGIAGGF